MKTEGGTRAVGGLILPSFFTKLRPLTGQGKARIFALSPPRKSPLADGASFLKAHHLSEIRIFQGQSRPEKPDRRPSDPAPGRRFFRPFGEPLPRVSTPPPVYIYAFRVCPILQYFCPCVKSNHGLQ